jgi:hypothetical protein
MVVASFRAGTPGASQTIDYDDGAFRTSAGAPLSAAQVVAYDKAGSIDWAYPGLRTWVYECAGEAATAAPTPSATYGYPAVPLPRRKPMSAQNKRIIVYLSIGGAAILLILVAAGAVSNSHSGGSGSQKKASDTISDGTYLVGTDIAAGRYKGSTVGGNGYWQISSDANGANIIENDNTTGDFYVEVRQGQYLNLSGVEITKTEAAAPTAAPASDTISDGTYLVGTDIAAGRYKGSAVGGNGYWQISSDANGANIIENDITTGDFYVEVTQGQYLKLSGVEITRVE